MYAIHLILVVPVMLMTTESSDVGCVWYPAQPIALVCLLACCVDGHCAWPGLHACSLLCGWPTSLLSGPGLDNPNYPSGTSVSQCSLMHTRHFQGKKGITQKDTETKTQALNCHGRDILKNVQEGGPQDK